MSFDSVHQTLINTGSMPDVSPLNPKGSVEKETLKPQTGFMPATDARPGKTVKPVKTQSSWLIGALTKAWNALSLENAAYYLDFMPDFDISSAFEDFDTNTSVSVVKPELHMKETRPETPSPKSTVIQEQKPDESIAPAEKERTSGIPVRKAGYKFTKKPEGVSLTRPDRGKTGIPMPGRQQATQKQSEVKTPESKRPVKQEQATTKKSIFAFNTVKRDDYYLHGDLPAAETIRKLNEHAREAKLRTPEEQAAKPEVKEIDPKLYQRLQSKGRIKANPAPTTVTSTRQGKKQFKGDLKKLIKPLEGHAKAKGKFVSNAELVANFPKTLRSLETLN
ncbi:hypothetical protein [Endozoicomonas lisbonensis]|uniref:Uncharacterized protein n=1 Tax=Endozoicomonas lisbonensis TaxID=3120522 RepID=A0ABV2SDF8_9GAMM